MVTNFNVANWANREIKISPAKTRYTVSFAVLQYMLLKYQLKMTSLSFTLLLITVSKLLRYHHARSKA